MRWWPLIAAGLVLAACSSNYEGETYPQVVRTREVRVVDEVPSDARIIGRVFERDETTVEDGSLIDAFSCNERQMRRRLKRTAAQEGGEFLVGLHCESYEEDAGEEWDPVDEEWDSYTYCELYCAADVARRWVHDQ